jgi:hypothetical protein
MYFRPLFLLSLFLIIAQVSSAQEKARTRFSLSLFGGANNGKLSYDDVTYNGMSITTPKSEWKWRPYYGIETDVWFSDKWALMFRPAYVAKGSYEHNELTVVFDGKTESMNAIEDVTLEYLQLPLGVRGMFGRGIIKTSFFLAPRFDFQLSAKDHITLENGANTTIDVPDLETVAFGFIIGTSLGVDVTRNLTIFAEVLYDHGFTDIVNTEDFYPDVNTRDYRVGISFMYKFD